MRLAIDLYAGLGGWTEGLQAAGWDVIGFDIERHAYGDHQYPAQLVVQDVLTLDGVQFRDAGLIVASPPCQEYSYMAMPWKRAKQIERALKGEDEFPDGYKGSRTVDELNSLFDACFRIQREASEAKGEHVPLVVENVCGAQKWVGPARWRHGSYYLWGDVPALMPVVRGRPMMKPPNSESPFMTRAADRENSHLGRGNSVRTQADHGSTSRITRIAEKVGTRTDGNCATRMATSAVIPMRLAGKALEHRQGRQQNAKPPRP